MKASVLSHRDLRVYQGAADLRRRIYVLTTTFPECERYELTQQIRRSSRAGCAAIGEAWRKRRYKANWISKLSDAEQEFCETQIWIETAEECGYIDSETATQLLQDYEVVLAQLTLMAIHADKWVIRKRV